MQALKIAEAAQAAASRPGEDEVVEKAAVEGLGNDGKAARFSQVACARPRIAARMVMGEDDTRAFVVRRVQNDFA